MLCALSHENPRTGERLRLYYFVFHLSDATKPFDLDLDQIRPCIRVSDE